VQPTQDHAEINTEGGGHLGIPPPENYLVYYIYIVECDMMIHNNFLCVYVVSDATETVSEVVNILMKHMHVPRPH
jgi:hypothetical protein